MSILPEKETRERKYSEKVKLSNEKRFAILNLLKDNVVEIKKHNHYLQG